jgi:hypothetical protein
VHRTRLLMEITDRTPLPGETVYVQRRGDEYDWHCVNSAQPLPSPGQAGSDPDAWLCYCGPWPAGDPDLMAAHLDDMLAEMESMCGGDDRCRWPLDQPYPLHH